MVACGTKGVPLLYVICNKGDPNYDFEDWKKLAVNCASLNGLTLKSEKKTVKSEKKTVHLFFMTMSNN